MQFKDLLFLLVSGFNGLALVITLKPGGPVGGYRILTKMDQAPQAHLIAALRLTMSNESGTAGALFANVLGVP